MARVGTGALAVLLVALAACSSSGDRTAGDGRLAGRLEVAAAASLTDVFAEIGRRFEADHPGARVSLSFGASSAVAAQVRAGAPLDVVAVAEEEVLADLVEEGLVAGPRRFARNRLEILVEAGNPRGIEGLDDLGRPGLDVVVCAAEVPCGRLAARLLASAGVDVTPRSYEPNVRAVVSRVVLGEADAGLVYVTDVRAAGARAEGVAIPEAGAGGSAAAVYALARVRASGAGRLADAFVAYVASQASRGVLSASGFEVP